MNRPQRPTDPNPLFTLNDAYVVKSASTPMQKQRALDGTPHTRGGRTGLHPGNVEPVGDNQPSLYLEKSLVATGGDIRSGSAGPIGPSVPKVVHGGGISDKTVHGGILSGVDRDNVVSMSINPDEAVKSFLKGSYGVGPMDAAAAKKPKKAPQSLPQTPTNPVGGEEKAPGMAKAIDTLRKSVDALEKAGRRTAFNAGTTVQSDAKAPIAPPSNVTPQQLSGKEADYHAVHTDAADDAGDTKLADPAKPKKDKKAGAAGKYAGKKVAGAVNTAVGVAGKVANTVLSVIPTSGR